MGLTAITSGLSIAEFSVMLIDRVMHRLLAGLVCGVILFLSACEQKDPAPAVAVEIDASALEHERLFGAEAKAPDITWRSSGLGIRILAPGEGPAPKMTDTVRVHYVGRLKDGQVFDDSHTRGKPADFVVNYLITGWAAAMPSLKAGGHAVFFIPPVLGYGGVRSAGIPPNSGLIFEVELIAVNPEKPPEG